MYGGKFILNIMTIICKKIGLLGLFMSIALSGCSYYYTVEGQITFEDGTPLTIGTILFESDRVAAKGTINTKGQYSVKILGHGVRKIYILGAVQVSHEKVPLLNNRHDSKQHVEQLIDMKYRFPETSGLIYILDGGAKYNITHNITVTKPKTAEMNKLILSE
jgi:hypothetical protein